MMVMMIVIIQALIFLRLVLLTSFFGPNLILVLDIGSMSAKRISDVHSWIKISP